MENAVPWKRAVPLGGIDKYDVTLHPSYTLPWGRSPSSALSTQLSERHDVIYTYGSELMKQLSRAGQGRRSNLVLFSIDDGDVCRICHSLSNGLERGHG